MTGGNAPQPKPPLTVWHNTRCPGCDAGIRRQKRRLVEAVKAGRIAFRDIDLEPDVAAAHGGNCGDGALRCSHCYCLMS